MGWGVDAAYLPQLLERTERNVRERLESVLTPGVIVFVNHAWSRFAKDNGGLRGADAFVGSDYLAVCRDAVRRGDNGAQQALSGIEEVRRGEREEFSLDYPCHAPEQERWFRMLVTGFTVGVETCVVVAHHDITDPTRSRHALEATERLLRSVLIRPVQRLVAEHWPTGRRRGVGGGARDQEG
jgi:hypothetical protein